MFVAMEGAPLTCCTTKSSLVWFTVKVQFCARFCNHFQEHSYALCLAILGRGVGNLHTNLHRNHDRSTVRAKSGMSHLKRDKKGAQPLAWRKGTATHVISGS
jgi:hypothetical protein